MAIQTPEQRAQGEKVAKMLGYGTPAKPVQTPEQRAQGEKVAKQLGWQAQPLQNPVPVTSLKPPTTIQTPQPTAPDAQLTLNDSVTGAVTNSRAQLEKMYADQKATIDKELELLKNQRNETLQNAKQLTEPFREELEKKEKQRLAIDENFQENQKLTNELDSLLTESNSLIMRAKGLPISNRAAVIKTNRTLQDVQARSGVIQAVMSARNNQISTAYDMIDRTTSAIVADRTDSLNYYNTLLELDTAEILKLDNESKAIAQEQVELVKGDLAKAEATAEYVKKLMISPETASLLADSGVTLSDSVDTVNKKIATEVQRREVSTFSNELTQAGYDIYPVPVQGAEKYTINGQDVYAKVRAGSELDLKQRQAQENIRATQADIANTYSAIGQRDFENQFRIQQMNAESIGSGIAYSENGEQVVPTMPKKAPTVSEQQSLVFFSRMKEAVDNLDAVEGKIRGLGTVGQLQLNYAPAIAQTTDQQRYTQASRQFTEARLRKDSGAAIPEGEFANDRRMYFPQPGDSKETLEQKRKARETALSAIRQASGNAYWELYGESPTTVSRRAQAEQSEYIELIKNASPAQLRQLGSPIWSAFPTTNLISK